MCHKIRLQQPHFTHTSPFAVRRTSAYAIKLAATVNVAEKENDLAGYEVLGLTADENVTLKRTVEALTCRLSEMTGEVEGLREDRVTLKSER